MREIVKREISLFTFVVILALLLIARVLWTMKVTDVASWSTLVFLSAACLIGIGWHGRRIYDIVQSKGR